MRMNQDLQLSGLHPTDIAVSPLGIPERSALDIPSHTEGYIIPYFDMDGNPITFYRAKLFDVPQKYKQPRGSQNHVYFPPAFKATLNGYKYVIITEGEKKAAAAAAHGLPAVGLGGVYSWRNKTVMLPDTAVVSQKGIQKKGPQQVDLQVAPAARLQIRLPDEFDADRLLSEYAQGFESLVNLIIANQLTVFICFDCLPNGALKPDIQKAAARLAIELRFMGVPFRHIMTLPLPMDSDELPLDKVGLDDFLVGNPRGIVQHLVQQAMGAPDDDPKRAAFAYPQYPNMQAFVSKKLQSQRLSRKEMGQLGLSITADLDARGRRLRSKDGLYYYFDSASKRLMRATSPMRTGPMLLDDRFSSLLYTKYSITQNDAKLIKWLTSQFTSEEPIHEVEPKKNYFVRDDTVYYQINDSQFCAVSKDSITFHDNGALGILFQSTCTYPIDQGELQTSLLTELNNPPTPWWFSTLCQTRLRGLPRHAEAEGDFRLARIGALLYYISPWLFRWRGTQLPVEITTGEAGSGKSTLLGLRQSILQGYEDLKNVPQSIRDWHASVVTTGGLHVIDNISEKMDKGLKQSMADEMSRITTEPSPTVEMRKFYTEHELVKVPVNPAFVVTSLTQPFHQNDLIQRSIQFKFDKPESVSYDSEWASNQLATRGGRTAWVAHHLVTLQRFFQVVDQNWNPTYKASYRLINLEQAFLIMGKVFGWDVSWIPTFLAQQTSQNLSEADWILEGVIAYVDKMRQTLGAVKGQAHLDTVIVTAHDIAEWCTSQEDFSECIPLCSSRRLGRHMTANKSTIAMVTGLKEGPKVAGRQTYRLGRGRI